jgi:glycosyltransferase involved in cell wall biosynthesis
MMSIIIPTLNEEDRLPLLLASIKKQGFSDYEIIVADGGSKDATCNIAEAQGCRILSGGSPSVGRNRGAAAAQGTILLFLDADVILSSDFLVRAVTEFAKRDLGVAGFLIIPQDGKKIDTFLYGVLDVYVGLMHGLFTHATMASMAKKSVHDALLGFNESITLLEDYYYAKSASKISAYGYIRQPVYASMRRYEKDGRLTYVKYALAVLYTYFFGL